MLIVRSLLLALLLASVAEARNVSTLITDLRITLGQTDSANSNWTNTQLKRCLNMAQYIVAPHSGGVEDTALLPGGSSRISEPGGFIHLKGSAWLWRNGGENTPIPFVPVDSFAKVIGSNSPQKFGMDRFIITEDGGQIAIFPDVKTQDSVLISFYKFPSELDTAECEFDVGWEEVLLLQAAALASQKIDDMNRAAFYIQERDKQIMSLRTMNSAGRQTTGVP